MGILSQQILLRTVDLETVGFLDEQSEEIKADPCQGILEIGTTDIIVEVSEEGAFKGVTVEDRAAAWLFNPPAGIPLESCAIHHITSKMVEGLPPCNAAVCASLVTSPPAPTVLIAHNNTFEREWLDKYLPPETKWVCSLKVVSELFPEWKAHSNQAARYMLGLELDERADPPHRAGPDSYVTAHIVAELLRRKTSLRDMLTLTRKPRRLWTCPIGEWRDHPWDAVPADFLRWYIDKAKRQDPDTLFWCQHELQRRADLARNPDLSASDY